MTVSSIPAYPLYQSLEKTGEKRFAQFSQGAEIRKEIEYFKEQAKTILDPQEILDDRRLLTFILSAFSMDDEIQYPGRLERVLMSDTTDPDSLANRLVDRRFKEMAQTLDLANSGVFNFKRETFVEDMTDRYLTNEWEKSMEEQNPALREVAYFKRMIGSATGIYNILGDQVLRKVVTETLGLPQEIALQSVEAQARAVEARVDIGKFQDSRFVEKFVQRYLVLTDAAANQAAIDGTGGTDWRLGLLSGATKGGGLNILV